MLLTTWFEQAGFLLACLALPIAWGWLVDLAFVRFGRRAGKRKRSADAWIDYQI